MYRYRYYVQLYSYSSSKKKIPFTFAFNQCAKILDEGSGSITYTGNREVDVVTCVTLTMKAGKAVNVEFGDSVKVSRVDLEA